MKIKEDVKRLAESLLDIANDDNESIATIYSVNYKSRHPDSPFYKSPQSVQSMIKDGLLELIESGETSQPAPDKLMIHQFAYYKVKFSPAILRQFLYDAYRTTSSKGVRKWRELELDISRGTIRYKGEDFEISPDRNEIKLLNLLLSSKKIVEYIDIAKKLELNSYHKDYSNKDVAREIQYLKRDLLVYLKKKIALSEQDAKSLILVKSNVGLKIGN